MKRILVVLAVLVGCAKPVTPPAQHHVMAMAGQTITANQISFFRGNPDPPPPGAVAIVSTDGHNLLQQNSDGTTQAIGGGGSADGGTTTITAGTGISITTDGGTTKVTNAAPFGADTSISQNNSSSSPVTTWEGISAFVSNTAGAETTSYTSKLLSGGAQFTSFYQDPSGFVGIGTSTVNLGASAAGSRGITITSTASTPSVIEAKMPTTTSSNKNILQISGYNGATQTAQISLNNNSSTTDGRIRIFAGSSLTEVADFTSAGANFFNATVANSTLQVVSTALLQGNLTHTGSNVGFYNTTPVAQQTVGANVNNVASSGTTGQFDDFTNGVTYATDYASLHNTVYQLARSVAQLTVMVRACGLGH